MSSSPDITIVETYRFDPSHLKLDQRQPGISAFMRVRNGEAFLEAAIRSHMPFVDELVVVFNRCVDATEAILGRLQAEYGAHRLRLIDYRPRVHPPGGRGHRLEPPVSPTSFVNMSNLALTGTRYTVAMKLDDDHFAIADRFEAIIRAVRDENCRIGDARCFAGINLAYDDAGRLGALESQPVVGVGDHFLFPVGEQTRFIHDRRFEKLSLGGLERSFVDFAYWHLKYLKPDFGFGNRDVDDAGNRRFARKRAAFLRNRTVAPLSALAGLVRPQSSILERWSLNPEKRGLRDEVWRRLREAPPDPSSLAGLNLGGVASGAGETDAHP